jgi:hypothetical protein
MTLSKKKVYYEPYNVTVQTTFYLLATLSLGNYVGRNGERLVNDKLGSVWLESAIV